MLSVIRHLGQGFLLLFKPGVKRYVLTPLLINIIVYLGFISCAYHYTQSAGVWLTGYLPSWLSAIAWIVSILFFIGSLFFFTYIFTTIGNIIAAPFNGFLSEKIEQHLIGHTPENTYSFKALCLLLPKTILRQIKLLFYFLPRAFILLFFFFIPGLNLIAGILWFLFASWMMSIQYFDFPFDNHHVNFITMLDAMKKRRWLHLQFGIYVNILSIIPIVNLFVIPTAVAAATAIWVKEYANPTAD